MQCTAKGKDFNLILTVKMETRHRGGAFSRAFSAFEYRSFWPIEYLQYSPEGLPANNDNTRSALKQLDHGPTIGPAAPMGGIRHGGLNTPESYL